MSARILISGLLAVLQGQLLPYAPQAKRALYAKLATALFLKALRKVVDSTVGDVVQLVRTLPCHGRGREFESRRPRHFFQSLTRNWQKLSWSIMVQFQKIEPEIAGVF